jgi:cell division protein FtsI (penicillin-binding protein 3)
MGSIKKDIKVRVYACFIIMCLGGIAIIGKAAALQIVSGKKLKAQGLNINTRVRTLDAERGNIYSADGSLLCVTMPVFETFMDLTVVHPDTFKNNVKGLSQSLSNLFEDKAATQYEQELNAAFKKKSRYFSLQHKVDYEKYMAMRDFPILKLGQHHGGFIAEKDIKRVNPFGLLGNRTIGLFRKNSSAVGLEAKYNPILKGESGQRVEQKIPGGAWMPIDGTEVDPQHGKDIITTIDVNVQGMAELALQNVLVKEQATYGTCIVMETKTGAIKAMANLGKQPDGSYWEDYNYALRTYEPGSTFKINALLSAIDDGYVTLDSKVSANGGVCYFAGQKMSDSHLGTGSVTVRDAFAHSSNVACAKLVYNNYLDQPSKYINHLKKMHIMDPTGIDIGGELKPHITKQALSFQSKSSLAWLAIGYEVSITPMRTCMIYNTIANNGTMMKPFIVKEVREYGQLVKYIQPEVVERNVCKMSTIEALKDAAFEVVESGTGKSLKNPVFSICGKTGTAQVADKGITYADKVYNGSFVGFFPKEDPMYTICVVIRTRKGSSNYYGGQIALPVFKEVANRLYAASIKEQKSFLKIDTVKFTKQNAMPGSIGKIKAVQNILNCYNTVPNAQWLITVADSNGDEVIATTSNKLSTMPNLSRMGLRDATLLLENLGLHISANGKGKIITQSIIAGTEFRKGQTVKLTLE